MTTGTMSAPGSLPHPLTPLVGRERELVDVRDLVRQDDVRLVTLTGPGGTGKTRLSLQVAAELHDAFPDGVYVVSLASVIDPAVVLPTIAQALGLREAGDRSLDAQLQAALAGKNLLLVLDNFEQLASAAPALAELLAACPGVTALVTSRSGLRVRGEREIPLPPLALPDPRCLPPPEELAHNPAIALFLDRARAAKPDLDLTAENAPTIAEICIQLDGLPLAIELAAARVKLLPPAAMLPRLTHRLALLTGGARDLPARLQTMRNAIAWSYDLLTPDEQALFRRLAVFAGGCTLDAAEAVTEGGRREAAEAASLPAFRLPPSASVLDGIASLLDHSLIRQFEEPDGEPRFVMLETIREYAAEQLAAAGEDAELRGRHAAFFADLAGQAEPALLGPDQGTWLHRLEAEYVNLRTALSWTIAQGQSTEALLLAGNLRRFWEIRAFLSEGRTWLDRALALPAAELGAARARALLGAATLARKQADHDRAVALYLESLDIWRELDDAAGIASALNNLGVIAHDRADYPRATALYEEALAASRQLGDRQLVAATLLNLGIVARRQGEFDRATALYEESVALWRELGDRLRVALSLNNLGVVAYNRGDLPRAVALYAEALAVWRELDDRGGIALSLNNLAEAVRDQSDLARAAALLQESLDLRAEQGDRAGIAEGIAGFAAIAAKAGKGAEAIRLYAAADALRTAIGVPFPPPDREKIDRAIATLRAGTTAAAFNATWDAGRAFSIAASLAEAATVIEAVSSVPAAPALAPPGIRLTKREIDVLSLIVEGRSDKEIGEALFISHRTAMTHVTNILNKLGVNSRTAAAFAVRNGLA
ncbi:MAG: tetratricopeptide repeat protein [Thermomicrobiales bacterium]